VIEISTASAGVFSGYLQGFHSIAHVSERDEYKESPSVLFVPTHVNARYGFVHLLVMQVSKAKRTSPWSSYMIM